MFSEILIFCLGNLTALLTTVIVLLFGIHQWFKRPPNFPPGPVGLPVIGVAHKLGSRAEIALMKMSHQYGPIMGVKLLRNFTVLLSDLDCIQEAFVKQGPAFAGRPNYGIFQTFTKSQGVIAIDGPKWKENRKFGTAILRKLGSGKKVLEEKIADEMIGMCSALEMMKGKAFDISNLVTHSVANVICGFAFGKRFDYSDVKFISVARSLVDWFSSNSDAFLVMLLVPVLEKFPPFSWLADSLTKATKRLCTVLLPIIEEHKKTLDPYEYRDFVDAYLHEIEKTRDQPHSFYTEEDLKGYVRDFFVAGTDTTSTTLKWCLIFLINRRDVQKRIQKEIDKVIGPDGRPKMSHLEDMHFTKAFITEVFRYRTPGPLGLMHRTVKPIKIRGYEIPEDTQILANFWALHHDPKLWKDADEFHPERFLDENGKYQKSPYVLPFSIGSRYCMGESMARMEIFFFIVCILQRFHLELEAEDAPKISEDCERSGQFLIAPKFKMQIKERFCRAKSIKEYQDSMWD